MKEAIGPKGQRFDAATAPRRGPYRCAVCGGRVFLRRGATYAPAFAHHEGQGIGCHLYFEGEEGSGPSLLDDDEDDEAASDSDKLTLLVRPTGSAWALILGIEEMNAADARASTLATLRRAELRITAGGVELARLPATDVRHGIPRARADAPVAPSTSRYRVSFVGDWPRLAFTRRDMHVAGLNLRGTLFRDVRGEWMRVQDGARVLWGQALYLVAQPAPSPPTRCIVRTFGVRRAEGAEWQLWRLALPSEPARDVERWLTDLGHEVASPRWRVSLVSVPRGFTQEQDVQLYTGDALLAAIDGPPREASASLTLETPGRATALEVEEGGRSFAFARPPIGHGSLRVEAEDDVVRAFEVIPRPTAEQLRTEFARLPRLVVCVGGKSFAPGRHVLHRSKHAPGAAFTVETGVDGVRVALMIQTVSGRRVLVGVTPSEAARALNDSFSTEVVESFRIDAGALGACLASFEEEAVSGAEASPEPRLAGWLSAVARSRGGPLRPIAPWTARAASRATGLRGVVSEVPSSIAPAMSALLRRFDPERSS